MNALALSPPRISLLTFLILSILGALEWRLFHLQVLRHEELRYKAEAYRFTRRVEQSWRGQIRDSHDVPIAVTLPVRNLYADLAVWSNRIDLLAGIVAPLLKTDPPSLAHRVQQSLVSRTLQTTNAPPGALLLKRGVTPAEWTAIKEALTRETFGLPTNNPASRQKILLKRLRRWTLFPEEDQFRCYLHGSSLAPVLGFVGSGMDGHLLQGKWGIEASWNTLLAGRNGVCDSSRDVAGNELAFCRTRRFPARDGGRVILTIDLSLQKIVEEALAKAVTRHNPSNATCVVVRPRTGEILAMATLPTFFPQQPGASPMETWRNRVISDRNEMGSVFKVITLAAALEAGVVTLDQQISCENGHWLYNRSILHDDTHHFGLLTVRECLTKSSNIGLAKVGLLLGPQRFYCFATNFGFNQVTGLPLLYEIPGFIRHPTNWSAISLTRLAIGHELAVTQMELAMAYAAIANDGKLLRPLLIDRIERPDGSLWVHYDPQIVRSVVRPETARKVRDAMTDVVEHGTGKAAALPAHTVAGKTGTAQKSDGHRYIPGRLYCSFVGMVPAQEPELVIAVAIDEPKGNAYGGTVAAPVFREIAEQAVVLYNIPPDKNPGPSRRTILSGSPKRAGDFAVLLP